MTHVQENEAAALGGAWRIGSPRLDGWIKRMHAFHRGGGFSGPAFGVESFVQDL